MAVYSATINCDRWSPNTTRPIPRIAGVEGEGGELEAGAGEVVGVGVVVEVEGVDDRGRGRTGRRVVSCEKCIPLMQLDYLDCYI